MPNELIVGSTRSGKSQSTISKVIEAAEKNHTAIVICDPHRDSLADGAFKQLVARGYQDRILYDRLADLDRVLAWDFLAPSTADNPVVCEAENDERIRSFQDILTRRRNVDSLASSPLLEEWVIAALKLYIAQQPRQPLSVLRYVFDPDHPLFSNLVANCTDAEVARKFQSLVDGKSRRNDTTSARRLFDAVCSSPAFLARCSTQSFNFSRFLLDRGILIIEGGSHGTLSLDAMQTMMGAIILKVIHIARNRWKDYPRIMLVLDEANNANLVGTMETRAMAELQKCGLDFSVLVQNLNFPSSTITSDVLTNCVRHEWFFVASADLQRKAISDLGDPELKTSLQQLRVGERFVKDRQRVYREYVPMLDDPWTFPGLSADKAKVALESIRRRPEYRDGSAVYQQQQIAIVDSPSPTREESPESIADTQSIPPMNLDQDEPLNPHLGI